LRHTYPQRADQHDRRSLPLAATTTESDVETALRLLLESGTAPTSAAVRALVCPHAQPVVPAWSSPQLHLSLYDQLLRGRRSYAQSVG
jgi:hypothetical protein